MNRCGKWITPYFSMVVSSFEQKTLVSRIWYTACFLQDHLRRSHPSKNSPGPR
jgi:hypothetical protein